MAVDAHGFANPLLAAYRTASVRAALPIPAANRPAKLLLEVPHLEVAVTGPAGRDVDTPADLDDLDRRAPTRQRHRRHPAASAEGGPGQPRPSTQPSRHWVQAATSCVDGAVRAPPRP